MNMRTSMNRLGHVADIEKADRQLNGFLTLFAGLSKKIQLEIVAQVDILREELKDNPEVYFEKIEALAEMYGALKSTNETPTKGNLAPRLTARLEEIAFEAKKLVKAKGAGGK